MFSKLFSHLIARRLFPCQKFPRLKLLPRADRKITHKRNCIVAFSSFDPPSLTFAQKELEGGDIVELRRSDDVLLGLGFFEPKHARVDLFDLSPRSVSMLPLVGEDFFISRVDRAWSRRRESIENHHTNAYRILHGHADGVPSLYVDIFSPSFARVIATTNGSERLVPAVADYLRSKGAEEIIVDTPSIRKDQILSLVTPTIPLESIYVESGTRHYWIEKNQFTSVVDDPCLLNTAHRRARQMLKDLSVDKRVLCINDRSAGAALNALMSAKKLVFVQEDEAAMTWSKKNLVANHGSAVFRVCETVNGGLNCYENASPFDVIYIESHPLRLSTRHQWKEYLKDIFAKKLCGDNTIFFLCQDRAPLGILDLLPKQVPISDAHSAGSDTNLIATASYPDIAAILSEVAGEFEKNVRFLRKFSASIDYPVLPDESSIGFTYICVTEPI